MSLETKIEKLRAFATAHSGDSDGWGEPEDIERLDFALRALAALRPELLFRVDRSAGDYAER